MDALTTLEHLLGEAAERMHDTDILWYTQTETLYEALVDQVVSPLEKRIAELGAQVKTLQNARQWSPVEHREVIGDERWPETVWLVIGEHGFSFCTSYSTDHIRLPAEYGIFRRVQP